MHRRKYNASKQEATPRTMAEVVAYLQRLAHAGQLRAVAVAYCDPEGRDYNLLAVQHLDQTAAAAIGRGLTQLSQTLAADSL